MRQSRHGLNQGDAREPVPAGGEADEVLLPERVVLSDGDAFRIAFDGLPKVTSDMRCAQTGNAINWSREMSQRPHRCAGD